MNFPNNTQLPQTSSQTIQIPRGKHESPISISIVINTGTKPKNKKKKKNEAKSGSVLF